MNKRNEKYTTYPFGSTNLITSVDDLERQIMFRPGQKSVEKMVDLISMFCKARVHVLDTCTGSLATAKLYLQLPGHYSFFGKPLRAFIMHPCSLWKNV